MDNKGQNHKRKLLYDRYVKYLFIASAVLMSLLIFSIVFLSASRD